LFSGLLLALNPEADPMYTKNGHCTSSTTSVLSTMSDPTIIDDLLPGDLARGWRHTREATGSYIGPDSTGVVLRTHRIKLEDGRETLEIWLLLDGKETRWLANELELVGRGDRVVEGSGLENRRSESYRGFESHPLHQPDHE
jgi:hypothetical protein